MALIMVLVYLCPQRVKAQFSDSTHYYINYAATGSLNRTSGNQSYLLNNALKYSMRKKYLSLNESNSYVYGAQNSALTNNDFTSTLDFNVYPHAGKRLFFWGLGNFTTSYSLKVNSQAQTGLGAAYNIIRDSSGNFLNISDGMLYERSNILLNDTTRDIYGTFRNSLRIRFSWTFQKLIVFAGSGYLQNSLSHSDDYIARVDMSLGIKLRKWLTLTSALSYNRITRTNKENLLMTYGLVVERFF